MISDYLVDIKKAKGPHNHRIKNSYGAFDAFRHYKKNKGTLTEKQYRKVIRAAGAEFASILGQGKALKLPKGIGTITVLKSHPRVWKKENKTDNNYAVDWNSTLRLWYEDKDAAERKQLVRYIQPEIFKVVYLLQGRTYKHHGFYGFKPNRKIKLMLKQNINAGKVDAFLKSNETKHGKY